ncbi:RDD family protein, partial [Cellulomonas hominis]|uniref:RDD family protein n=1 Tax=Cellulomonas hominis TaxID=156981 RepID=UPI001BCFE360
MSSTNGSGVPGAYGAPPAPLGRRVAAWLLDGVLTSLAAAPLWLAQLPVLTASLRDAAAAGTASTTAPEPVAPNALLLVVGAVLLLAWAGFQWWCHGTRGWTVGRRALGLRTVDVRTGRPIGLGRALGRYLVVVLGALACGIGQAVVLLSPLFDGTGRRRGWHDRVGEAIVVDVRGLATTRRVASWDGRAPATTTGSLAARVPGGHEQPAQPGTPALPAPAPSVDPTPSEPTRTRWTTLATERQLDGPGLVLPPLGAPGPGPDVDTRQMPVVPPAAAPAHPAAPTVVAPGWPAMAPAPQPPTLPAPASPPAHTAPTAPAPWAAPAPASLTAPPAPGYGVPAPAAPVDAGPAHPVPLGAVPANPVPLGPGPLDPGSPDPGSPDSAPGAWGRHAARPAARSCWSTTGPTPGGRSPWRRGCSGRPGPRRCCR